MNARELLFTCLALVAGSIVVIPALSFIGIKGNVASTLSSLSMLGGIVVAFMTIKADRDSKTE